MRLKSLSLKEFRGITFTLRPDGGDTDIFGQNGAGKTSLFSAWTWLLYGKDSGSNADFTIKTLDAQGNVAQPGINHEVEAEIDLENGKPLLNLKKAYHEVYRKQRGKVTKEFSGNTADYWVDGVPVAEKEYKAVIAAIASEATLRLLSDPLYFNRDLHWTERRRLVLQIVGDVSEEDVIASDKALAHLPEMLKGHDTEQYKKIVKARQSVINDEMKSIPTRIDEATRSLADITDLIIEELPADIAKLKGSISEKQAEVARIKNGGEIAEKRKRIAEIETEMLDILRGDREGIETLIQAKGRELSEVQLRQTTLIGSITGMERTVEHISKEKDSLDGYLSALRQQWFEDNSKQFTFEQSSTCPTCSQALPESKLQEARDKALAAFNLDKAQKLERNVADGKRMKERVDQLKADLAYTTDQITKQTAAAQPDTTLISSLQEELEALRQQSLTHTGGPAYSAKLQEKALLENEIAGLTAGNTAAVAKVQEGIAGLNLSLDALVCSQAAVTNNESTEKRISQLKEQEKTLAAEFEKLEGELFLLDQFTRSKVSMLEERINSKFKLVRFKMFNILISGALEDCCEATYKGVPWTNDLNTAAKLNTGIDVINVLSEYFGLTCPLFLDNRDLVSKIIDTESQVINLYVSEADKSLRVA